MMLPAGDTRYQSGTLMIDVLVSLLVLAIGMWAMLDLHTRLQVSETEAYQRTQALTLLDDMANRMMSNRWTASAYATDATLGIGALRCADVDAGADLVARDRSQWCQALQGVNTLAGGEPVGAVIDGRGCVEAVSSAEGEEYLVTVVWQGATPLTPPPAGVRCGKDLYNRPPHSACARSADSCRRYVSTLVHIASLDDE